MTWYYIQDEERKGPVEDADFEALVRAGSLGLETLVWREGMDDWQPLREVASGQGSKAPEASPDVSPGSFRVPCSRCGVIFQAEALTHIGGVAVCPSCKPLAVQALKTAAALPQEAERLRRIFLRREMGVQQLGFLSVLAGCLFVVGGIGWLFSAKPDDAITGSVILALGALFIATGIGLNKLRPWSRVAAGCIAGLTLLGFATRLVNPSPKPWTTWDYLSLIFNCCVLYLLFSRQGSIVFSARYQQAIAATPHVKQGLSVITVIAVVLFVFLLVLGVGVLVVSTMGR